MKFYVKRSSDWIESTPPCPNAQKDGNLWVVNIKSLKALVELANSLEERLIVFPSNYYKGFFVQEARYPFIEIYDDRRE